MQRGGGVLRIAVISDIHSNHHALKEVLEDIKKRSIDTIICTGDLVGYLPFPNEVIDIIREHKILTIKGNHDAYISNIKKPSKQEYEEMKVEEIKKSASALFTSFELTENNCRFLEELPNDILISIERFRLLFVHGSPRAISEYMFEDIELLKEITSSTSADVIISGHTHLPYHIKVASKDIINAGSVGKPKHGNANSTYVIIEILNGMIKTEIIEVSSNVEQFAPAIYWKVRFYVSDII